jgi:hypothetical protein
VAAVARSGVLDPILGPSHGVLFVNPSGLNAHYKPADFARLTPRRARAPIR